MSTLTIGSIQTTANAVVMGSGTALRHAGQVVQVFTTRTDLRTSYISLTSGNGTTISALNLTITPKFSSSLIVMEWMLNCEVHHDNVFLVHQDGNLITTSGYEGYNNGAGNQRWSGYVGPRYDADEDSTMSNYYILYSIPATNLNQRTYAPAVRSSGSTTYVCTLNKPLGSQGQDAYENAVSTGMIMEIQQ
jgi:hypothetical protein